MSSRASSSEGAAGSGGDRRASQPDIDPETARAAQACWVGVELRHLTALRAVAREGSFRGAADRLGYVQSAVSGQVAQLERAVGVRLFERGSGTAGTTPTPAGRLLLDHAEQILARFDAARADLRALTADSRHQVRVAVLESIAPGLLPPILQAFARELPRTAVAVEECYRDEPQLQRISGGELDLLITELPLIDGPFAQLQLQPDPYVLLAPRGDSLANASTPPSAAELARRSLILPAPRRGQGELEQTLRELGATCRSELVPLGGATIQALVGSGLGAAIVPTLSLGYSDPRTIVIELADLLPPRAIALVCHRERDHPAHIQAFIRVTELVARAISLRSFKVGAESRSSV